MNYEQALSYIHSVSWEFCKPGLERITELTKSLGDPQDSLRFIHVAGTNGKGSFCSMLDSVLRAAGYRVGLFTSPYIRFFNERMCIDGTPISDTELAEITAHVRPYADAMTDKPTEFELITAISLEYFRRNKVDIVIFEAGMGGRLDSTNVITTPILSVITGIALDHTAFLGDTVEKIAAEKAGIIKRGIPVLWGGEDEAARAVIADTAHSMGSRLYTTDYSRLKITTADLDGTRFDYGERKDLRIGLLGLYQPKNAANVLCATDALRDLGLHIGEDAIREGLARAIWHARFELLSQDPVIIYDGAHNPQGIDMFVKSVRAYFNDRKIILVSTVMGDKDYERMVRDLSTVTDRAYIFKVNDRALATEAYAEVYRRCGVDAYACESITEALSRAVPDGKQTDTPVICAGSLYMYAEVAAALGEILKQ